MTTEPIDDRYPEAWRPRGAPPFDTPPEPKTELQPLEMELHLAAMDPAERAAMLRRIGVAE